MLRTLPPISKDVAHELLHEWLTINVEFQPRILDHHELVYDCMEVYTLLPVPDDLDATRRNALAVRRAMEGLNALACCRGLDMNDNPAFWRRELIPFGDLQSRPTSVNYRPFAPDLMMRYQVLTSTIAPPEATAYAMATCFSMDLESEAMQVRREVHEQLAGFLTRRPPMLKMEMYPLPYGDVPDRGPEETWRLVRRSLLHTGRLWEPDSYCEPIQMAWTTTVDGGGLLEASELLALDRVVELRDIELTVPDQDPASIARQLRLFMHELVHVDTVRNMSWNFTRCDRACFEAIYSAIPMMKSLKSFSITCDDLKVTDTTIPNVRANDTHVRSYYVWLAYALAMRQLAGRPVAVGIDFVSGTEDLFGRALQSSSTLIDVIGVSFGQDHTPVFLPFGSTAVLRSRVILTTGLAATERLRDRTVSVIAEQHQRVDIIALCGSKAVLVWPGCGLFSVDATNLQGWKTRSALVLRPIVSDLTCSNSEASAIAAYLAVVGSNVRRLYVGTIRATDGDVFQQMLRSCPRLDTLFVSSLDEIESLLAAYEDESCSRLSTLKIGALSNRALHQILTVLGNPATRMVRFVKQLSIELTGVSEDDARAIASMLTRNRRLTHLRLDGRLFEGDDESTLDCLREFVDQPVQCDATYRGKDVGEDEGGLSGNC